MKRHEYVPAPVDLRHHVDAEIIGEVTFIPDPFDAEQLRRKRRTIQLDSLGGRKKPHGHAARKLNAIFRETGLWIR